MLYLTSSFVCLDHPHLLFNYWMSGFITFVFATRTYIASHEFLALTVIGEFLIQIFLARKSSVGNRLLRASGSSFQELAAVKSVRNDGIF